MARDARRRTAAARIYCVEGKGLVLVTRMAPLEAPGEALPASFPLVTRRPRLADLITYAPAAPAMSSAAATVFLAIGLTRATSFTGWWVESSR